MFVVKHVDRWLRGRLTTLRRFGRVGGNGLLLIGSSGCGCWSCASKAALAAKNCSVIRCSEANTAVRICSAVRCSIEVALGSGAAADVDCSGCMMRGYVTERGEVSRGVTLECA
jgi:hypothetical protein